MTKINVVKRYNSSCGRTQEKFVVEILVLVWATNFKQFVHLVRFGSFLIRERFNQ